jgi:hypothetical protein
MGTYSALVTGSVSLTRVFEVLDEKQDVQETSTAAELKLSASGTLAPGAEDSCWVESLARGWLFLLPVRSRRGVLIGVGPELDELLLESRFIGRQVGSLLARTRAAPGYPRIADPLCGPGWLACGTAALSFDPICGEGAGDAVREAILATAVLRRLNSADLKEGRLVGFDIESVSSLPC